MLDLTVLPRDEVALRKRCDDLINRLKMEKYFTERAPIAEELSYIKDPIAIPYLTELAEEKEEYNAIRGLMRIGTDEAMEALIEVTKSKYDKEAAAYAKALLREKASEIQDPKIREKVLSAVE